MLDKIVDTEMSRFHGVLPEIQVKVRSKGETLEDRDNLHHCNL